MQVDALLESGRLAQDQHGHITLADRLPVLSQDQPHQPGGRTTGQCAAALPVDPVAAFLARPHPRPLKGPWLAGWALDFHSRFDGDANSRSLIGDLVFRYKYGQEHQLAQELAQRWDDLLAGHPELPRFDAVVPVPPSLQRASDPLTMLAQALAARLQSPGVD